MTPKPIALVFGATGRTGSVIVDGLLRSDKFKVAVATRSETNAQLDALRDRGVDVRIVDVSNTSAAQLEKTLTGVDFVVSALSATVLEVQRPLFAAAKAAGVKRIISSDFSPSILPGYHKINDQKLAIREYIRSLNVPHTFIEIGWWIQIAFPYPPGPNNGGPLESTLNTIYGDGNQKNALTDMQRIGDIVARVLLDERAINQTIFFHEVEASQNEVWDVAQKISGLGDSLLAKQTRVPAEALEAQLAHAKAELKRIPEKQQTFTDIMARLLLEYLLALYIRGDNTLNTAKQLGKLDGGELYPDLKVTTLESYATVFYGNLPKPLL